MIKPYVITLDNVKTFLGISDATYDVSIETYIPVVSDDLTRTSGICNKSFLVTGSADTAGSITLSNVSLTDDEWNELYTGSCVLINSEDGVISSYSKDALTITLKEALTSIGTDQELEIRNFPYGAKAIVSQMILFKIQDGSVKGATFGKDVSSRSVGPLSVSFTGGSEYITGHGYPSSLTKQLQTIIKPRFC